MSPVLNPSLNPFEQMKLKQASFTATDWQVHDAVNANIDLVLRGSATGLAEELGVSQPALTRFCKKLGYNGFSDFKMAVYQYHKSAAMDESPTTAIEYYCELLKRIPTAMEEAGVAELAERICASRMVLTTGYHKSALSAQLLSLNLVKFGMISQFWPYDHIFATDQVCTAEDTLVIFSGMGKSYREAVDTIREVPAGERPHLVLATMNSKNPLRNKVDQMIWLPNYQNQNYPQYLETQVTFMIFVDLLTNVIAQKISATRG